MQKNTRLVSLDALRGLTIAAMILVNNVNTAAYPQLDHAPWHGWTLADTVFPSFLWIMGVAMVFSLKRKILPGINKIIIWRQIFQRSVVLFCFGLFLNLYPNFDIAHVRILGVLQRIAVCYLIAASLFVSTNIKGRIIILLAILFGYWFSLKYIPVPGFGAGILAKDGNIVQYLDFALLKGHLYSLRWDPEGILSTLSAVATVLFGVLTGDYLSYSSTDDPSKKSLFLGLVGIGLLLIGTILNKWLPINKNLWTTSYVVFMAGFTTIVFAIGNFLIEVKKLYRLFNPFIVFGVNSLALYIIGELLGKTVIMISASNRPWWNNLYGPVLKFMGVDQTLLLFGFIAIFFIYIIAYILYKKKVFIKI